MDFVASVSEKLSFFAEDHLVGVLFAFALVVLGVFVAWIISLGLKAYVFAPLKLNKYLNTVIGFKESRINFEKIFLRLIVFVILFSIIKEAISLMHIPALDDLMGRISDWLSGVGEILLNSLGPISLALLFSYAAKVGVKWLCKNLKLDEQLSSRLEEASRDQFKLSETLSELAYGMVFFYFLPDILNGIGLEKLSGSISAMLSQVILFIPNLIVFSLLLFVGWLVAKLVRNVVEGFLISSSIDSVVQKAFGGSLLGSVKISKIIPASIYAIIIFLAVVTAMDKLNLETLTNPLQKLIDAAILNLPSVILSIALVAFAAYLGGVVSKFVVHLLKDMGFDDIYQKIGLSSLASNGKSLSEIVGFLVSASIVLMALMQALNTLNLNSLADALMALVYQSGHILLGVFVFGVGLYIAKTVSSWIKQAPGLNQAQALAVTAHLVIVTFSGAMALQQIGIADEIVRIAFALGFGSVALGFAIAIGLGGKAVAEDFAKDFASKFKK